jgi:hypothetical protein
MFIQDLNVNHSLRKQKVNKYFSEVKESNLFQSIFISSDFILKILTHETKKITFFGTRHKRSKKFRIRRDERVYQL